MTLTDYISFLHRRYRLGNATEHTFRSDLQVLIESMVSDIRATNEPKRKKCGAPDFIIIKRNIPVGFIEAKDIGDSDLQGLKKSGNKEQFDRYKESMGNIIFTDYLNFYLYRNGALVSQVAVGKLENNKIVPLPENFEAFSLFIKDFCTHIGQSIIKRDTPVMVIIGNTPYSGESANKGEWIMKLMEDYKKEPGGKEKLKERNPKWINDDYVKFLRYGQHFIEKNGSGILAFINPHGFLDNPTFRGMCWHLLKTFDKIYTIDLHGNAKKKETATDGGQDENVFDIMQGVRINIFCKK